VAGTQPLRARPDALDPVSPQATRCSTGMPVRTLPPACGQNGWLACRIGDRRRGSGFVVSWGSGHEPNGRQGRGAGRGRRRSGRGAPDEGAPARQRRRRAGQRPLAHGHRQPVARRGGARRPPARSARRAGRPGRGAGPPGLRGSRHRASRQRLRAALRQARQLLETGEVLNPDEPPTTRRTLRSLPLELATRRARGEGRL
jgi:hypothetical protein